MVKVLPSPGVITSYSIHYTKLYDPTVQYALILGNTRTAEGYWKKELSLADLDFDSPYNTYRRNNFV